MTSRLQQATLVAMTTLEQVFRGLGYALVMMLTLGLLGSGFAEQPLHSVAAALIIGAWIIRDGMPDRR